MSELFTSVADMAAPIQNPESVPMIAERLIATRQAMGLHQAAFCRLIGVSPQAWSNYESGRNRINHDQALKLCKATGVSLDWIYRGLTSGLPVNLAMALQALRDNQKR